MGKLQEASRNELLALTKSQTVTRYNKSAGYRGFYIVDIDTTSVFTRNALRVTCKVGDYWDTVEMNDILFWIQVEAEKNPNIMWHKNVKKTSCPGTNLEKFLPKIREEVWRRMKKGITWNVKLPTGWENDLKKTDNIEISSQKNVSKSDNTISVISDFPERLSKLKEDNPQMLQNVLQVTRKNFGLNITKVNKQISKIKRKYTIDDIRKLVNQNISVLLY